MKLERRNGHPVTRFGAIRRMCLRGLLVLALVLPLTGCGDGAEEMFETAQFEEVQNNKEHARKLYNRILRDYPDSPFAAKAQERLAALAREGG